MYFSSLDCKWWSDKEGRNVSWIICIGKSYHIQRHRSHLDGITCTFRLDLQLANITEERRILVEEQVFNRQRLKDLEKTSNDDRSKRLKDMHENELLKRKAMDLENRVSLAEADSRKAQAELLEKIQVTNIRIFNMKSLHKCRNLVDYWNAASTSRISREDYSNSSSRC